MLCMICNREFDSVRALGLHISASHKDVNKQNYYDNYMKSDPNEGICLVCGKPTKFKGLFGYARTCSISCGQKHPETRYKMSQTNLEKYGAINPYGSKEIRDKIKAKNKEKYGVENPFCLPGVNEKAVKNSHSVEANEKRKNTCIEKYRSEYHIASKEIRQKTINTLMEKYNVTNAYSIPDIHSKAIQNSLNYHDENGNDSSWEALLENALIEKEIVFYKHYNKDDINKLNIWLNKMSHSGMYKSAINVWTISDLEKRNCAIKHNLNYVVLWTLEDINTYITTL